jgi:hypothetical protein
MFTGINIVFFKYQPVFSKGGQNVKRSVWKRNSIIKFAAVSLFITAMIGCGFVASVP